MFVGTEELGHLEMVAAIVHQLTRNLTDEQVRQNPNFAAYFVDHTTGVYPTAASGFPWSAASIQSTGDVIADLSEDLAAEQKARKTYDNILRLSDDPDVNNVIRFLREREIVHFQRFGETNHTHLSRFWKIRSNFPYRNAGKLPEISFSEIHYTPYIKSTSLFVRIRHIQIFYYKINVCKVYILFIFWFDFDCFSCQYRQTCTLVF